MLKPTARATVVLAALLTSLSGCAAFRAHDMLPRIERVREFEVPWAGSFPSDVVVDGAGRVWFTDRLAHVIGMFDPTRQQFRAYEPPSRVSGPYGLVRGGDGYLWYAGSSRGLIGRIDPATGDIVEYDVPEIRRGPHLLTWHEGRLWFSVREDRGYGVLDPATGEATLYGLDDHRPYSVAVLDDAVWMSAAGSTRLLEIDPATGGVRVHDVGGVAATGELRRVHADAEGGLWFTNFRRGSVGRYVPATGHVRIYPSFNARSSPYGLTVTASGLVWYGETATSRVVVLDPVADRRINVQLQLPSGFVRHLAVDERRRRVWLPISDAGRIGLIEYR